MEQEIYDAWQGYANAHDARRGKWTSFDCPACHHNGESRDTKNKAAIIRDQQGITFKCFRCQFKTRYSEGQPLWANVRRLLG